MNFSEPFRQSNRFCTFSPDGKYLASSIEFRLIVRDVSSLQIHRLYSCVDTIQCIEWSADSKFLLCGMFRRGVTQVWSIDEPDWQCKIDEGSCGLHEVRWSGDGRHVMTTADFYLRMTIWSLTQKSVSYIRYPKQCQKGLDFSQDGRRMIVAERRHCSDAVSVFDCVGWTLEKHFSVATEDLSGIALSPDQTLVAVWESCLNYLLLVYRISDRQCIGHYSAYEFALGIKTVSWSPTGQFLAIGSYDRKVRVLNNITWKPILTKLHPSTLSPQKNTVVYKEATSRSVGQPSTYHSDPTGSLFNRISKYEVETSEIQFAAIEPDISKANPQYGVSVAEFSPDCAYMFTREDSMRSTLWIWNMKSLTLAAILVQTSPIKCVAWDPTQARLALCTGASKLFMWSCDGSLTVDIPVEGTFPVQRLSWHPSGKAIMVQNKAELCVCFLANLLEMSSPVKA